MQTPQILDVLFDHEHDEVIENELSSLTADSSCSEDRSSSLIYG